jgi:hypothetical protein
MRGSMPDHGMPFHRAQTTPSHRAPSSYPGIIQSSASLRASRISTENSCMLDWTVSRWMPLCLRHFHEVSLTMIWRPTRIPKSMPAATHVGAIDVQVVGLIGGDVRDRLLRSRGEIERLAEERVAVVQIPAGVLRPDPDCLLQDVGGLIDHHRVVPALLLPDFRLAAIIHETFPPGSSILHGSPAAAGTRRHA